MHLARTGAFARAVRQAKLVPTPSIHAVNGWGTVYYGAQRWLTNTLQRPATEASVRQTQAAFPEQSVSRENEVDPRKTASAGSSSSETPDFARYLKSQSPNKIVSDPSSPSRKGVNILSQPFVFDNTSNVTDSILSLVGRNLYDQPNHPIAITRRLIESVFPDPTFKNHVASNPCVTVRDNFDVLGFPADHPGRSRTDTYYIDSQNVLRTHSSAHQHTAFQYMSQNPEMGYTIVADVYRRDAIDRSHFPVFHQMEGARMWQNMPKRKQGESIQEQSMCRQQQIRDDIAALPKHDLEILDEIGAFDEKTNPVQFQHDPEDTTLIVTHLKRSLENLVQRVFTEAQRLLPPGTPIQPLKVRWIEAYFPFTSPSFELEVMYQGQWLELLGCGVVRQSILDNAGLPDRIGWAWGIGIERLAMLLFNIPDIRLFWSRDERFLRQFREGKITRFEPFSKYPPCQRDISFWINASPAAASPINAASDSSLAAAAGGNATKASPAETQPAAFHENDIMEIVRDVAGTLVEDVTLIDEFVSPKTGLKSVCYRINYRSHERTLTNEEVNELHAQVEGKIKELNVTLR